MREVTIDVISDLLPLYLAGEVSEKTAELVKEYLEDDPELAEKAKEMAKADALGKVPIPFKKEAALETYNEAKKWMTIRILGIVVVIGLVLMCLFTAIGLSLSMDALSKIFT